MAREYKKRDSEYWDNRLKGKDSQESQDLKNLIPHLQENFQPALIGKGLYDSVAATSPPGSRLKNPSTRSNYRTNAITTNAVNNKYANIYAGLLPYNYAEDGTGAEDAIELCQRAYFNVPSFRSTIDMMSEFADSETYLEGGTAKSRKFVNAWFKKLRFHDLKSQVFREYFRSGNVFLYRIDAKLKDRLSKVLQESFDISQEAPLPIKYIVLNPTDISTKGSLSFSEFEYIKFLTPFEMERLKNPKTEEDKEILKSLPKEVQDAIGKAQNFQVSGRSKKGSSVGRISIPLDPKLFHAFFFKKQDYEPLAIPLGFSVLDDINKKLELKKVDQAIARSVENVVLLITMGAEPDKGGINHNNLAAMQEIFRNQSVGRVLVSDFTTKGEFLVPDLRKVMGKEKYDVLNRDIEEGLQNILLGESKYADTEIKLKVFCERLEEARKFFLAEFVQPEVDRVCKAFGMRSWPEVKFKECNLLDNGEKGRLVVRLSELGVITPEQALKTLDKGKFPDIESLREAQKAFYKDREDGYYIPLVNSLNIHRGDDPAAGGGGTTSPSGGRPLNSGKPREGAKNKMANAEFARDKILDIAQAITDLTYTARREILHKYGLRELDEAQEALVCQVCDAIVVSSDKENWATKLEEIVGDTRKIAGLEIKPEILEIGAHHQLGDLSAAILYHSTQK